MGLEEIKGEQVRLLSAMLPSPGNIMVFKLKQKDLDREGGREGDKPGSPHPLQPITKKPLRVTAICRTEVQRERGYVYGISPTREN
jgi:hypothetical protein